MWVIDRIAGQLPNFFGLHHKNAFVDTVADLIRFLAHELASTTKLPLDESGYDAIPK
ncbi:MAG: hypothetical protein FWF05_09590 [Oscillospiraceae bacterium]|nr:hypothetical protein [Oscillospiraceae bacterium]